MFIRRREYLALIEDRNRASFDLGHCYVRLEIIASELRIMRKVLGATMPRIQTQIDECETRRLGSVRPPE